MREKLNNFRASYKEFKARLIKKLERPVAVCKLIFGYGIMLTLFAGGSLLLGYLVALILGGDAAAAICAFIKSYLIPVITYTTTVLVLFGIILMYLSGEMALTAKKKTPKPTASSKTDAPDPDGGEG
ncbi:MAG: hypothetical protein IJD51_05380 [Clostridia bacterium]|nr:hypothetical protein [Clostridia bacterium]